MLLVAILVSGVAEAQEPGPPPADSLSRDTVPRYRTEEIRVTVSRWDRPLARLPYSVAALDRSELQGARRTLSLEESLRYVPGLFTHNRRNFALGDRLSLRGVGARAQFGVRGLKVLADGIPLTFPDGQTSLTNLDLGSAGRAEILRGPASALHGNAGAGVLSYTTEAASPRTLDLETRLVGGRYGFWQGRLEASGTTAGVGYVADLGYTDFEGFREYARARVLQGNAVVRGSVGESGELRALLNLYRGPFAENPSSLDRETAQSDPRSVRPFIVAQGAGEEATQGQGGAALDLPLGEASALSVVGWGGWRDVWNPIPNRIIRLGRGFGGARSSLSGPLPVRGFELQAAAGFDLEVQWDDREEYENLGVGEPGGRAEEGEKLLDQGEHVVGIGPFLQLEAVLGGRWTLVASGRLDIYRFDADDRLLADGDDSGSRTFREFSPSVGVAWAVSDRLHAFTNYSTAFQTPTTSELSNRPGGEGGFNPELEPERLHGWEFGVRGSLEGARFGYALTGFVADVRNALIPFEGAPGETFFRNAGSVNRRGVEVSVDWSPDPRLFARLAYTLQRLRFDEFVTDDGDFSGREEPGVPDHWLTVGLTHRLAFGLRSELDFRWVDAYPVDDANAAWNESYRVVDLRVTLDRTDRDLPVRLFVGVENLFDERYNGSVVPNAFGDRFYEPAPGLELYGGLTWPIGLTGTSR